MAFFSSLVAFFSVAFFSYQFLGFFFRGFYFRGFYFRLPIKVVEQYSSGGGVTSAVSQLRGVTIDDIWQKLELIKMSQGVIL